MPESYRTPAVRPATATAVVVVHCSDPRYQPHFQNFLHSSLGLERYALIAVPGGAQFLAVDDEPAGVAQHGWRWMKFLREVAQAQRIILIGHDDCRWYFDLGFSQDTGRVRARIMSDLGRVRTGLLQRFPQLRIDSYFAALEGDSATIHAL